MKEMITKCPVCGIDTRHRITNKFNAKQGKLRRKVEHCTKCNRRRISKK